MIGRHYLTPLFEPRSVALVGASEDAEKVGGRVLENLLAGGFQGRLYAVNPRHDRVRSLACFHSLESLPEPADLAVIATPAATVPALVEQCGRAGIRCAVVLSAGFSEAGVEGAKLERGLVDAARRQGVRLLGPNCVGLMRPPLGLDATFARGGALAGSLALVSQSGAVCTAMLDWAKPNGIGFSSVVSLGASSDLDFGEVIDYLAADAQTEHILLYIEGVRDGRRLVGSLRAAARAKPVIVMKSGRHPAGSRAAVSHTGAIVGDDDIFDAVVRRTGVVRVASMTQLVAAAQALAAHVHPTGDRLAVITNGGGPGVMAADRAGDLQLPLAELAPATIAKLERALPANWSHGNPVDLIGDAGPERYRAAVAACLDDPGVDGVVAVLTPQAMTRPDAAADAVIAATGASKKPVIACWMGEASVASALERLDAAGVPAFRVPEMAVDAFAHIASYYRHQKALLETPGPLAQSEPPDLDAARALVRGALARGRSVLSATESKALLEAFRIPVARSSVAATVEEAIRAANAIGYPVAMKIDSPDVTHKTDVGGVRLGLADPSAVSEAWREMMAAVARLRPEARVNGASIEPMLARANARELMAGIVTDPIFGPALTFGAGGIAIEVLRDRTVALPPLNERLVDDMIRGTRVARMLGEFRNLPAVDRPALTAVLLRISEIACELPEVAELDVNPIVADEQGVVALDARVRLRAVDPARRHYAHLSIPPYPAELARRFDDLGVVLRPIRPEDAAIERELVEGLSPRTSYLRFRSGIRGLTPAMLARFTQIDYDREMALIAVAGEAGREREVGVCRYVTLPDGATCEYAIVLADAWQGRGLGRRMMQELIGVARARGLATMVGWVAADNEAMLRMCAELGFAIAPEEGDRGTRRVTLDLGITPSA
jgi:acetyltransferase